MLITRCVQIPPSPCPIGPDAIQAMLAQIVTAAKTRTSMKFRFSCMTASSSESQMLGVDRVRGLDGYRAWPVVAERGRSGTDVTSS